MPSTRTTVVSGTSSSCHQHDHHFPFFLIDNTIFIRWTGIEPWGVRKNQFERSNFRKSCKSTSTGLSWKLVASTTWPRRLLEIKRCVLSQPQTVWRRSSSTANSSCLSSSKNSMRWARRPYPHKNSRSILQIETLCICCISSTAITWKNRQSHRSNCTSSCCLCCRRTIWWTLWAGAGWSQTSADLWLLWGMALRNLHLLTMWSTNFSNIWHDGCWSWQRWRVWLWNSQNLNDRWLWRLLWAVYIDNQFIANRQSMLKPYVPRQYERKPLTKNQASVSAEEKRSHALQKLSKLRDSARAIKV